MPRSKQSPSSDETDPLSLVPHFPVHKDMSTHDSISAVKAACIEDSGGEAVVIGRDALARLIDNAA